MTLVSAKAPVACPSCGSLRLIVGWSRSGRCKRLRRRVFTNSTTDAGSIKRLWTVGLNDVSRASNVAVMRGQPVGRLCLCLDSLWSLYCVVGLTSVSASAVTRLLNLVGVPKEHSINLTQRLNSRSK